MLPIVTALLLSATLSVQEADTADQAGESPESWANGLVASLVDVAGMAAPQGRITIDDPASLSADLTAVMSEVWPILQEGDGEQGEINLSFDLHVYSAGETQAGDELCPAGSDGVAFEGPFEDAGAGTMVRVCRGFEESDEGNFYGQAIVLQNGLREGVFIFTLVSRDAESGELNSSNGKYKFQ